METKTQALVDWLTAERELTELAPLSQPSTVEANPWLERNLWLRAERLASSQSDLTLEPSQEDGNRFKNHFGGGYPTLGSDVKYML